MSLATLESATAMAVGQEEWTTELSVLYLEGHLRAPVSPELRRRVEALLTRGRRLILLDLSNVIDLDAAGLGELVRLHTLAEAAKGQLWVRNITARTRKLSPTANSSPSLATASQWSLTTSPSRAASSRPRKLSPSEPTQCS